MNFTSGNRLYQKIHPNNHQPHTRTRSKENEYQLKLFNTLDTLLPAYNKIWHKFERSNIKPLTNTAIQTTTTKNWMSKTRLRAGITEVSVLAGAAAPASLPLLRRLSAVGIEAHLHRRRHKP